MAASSFRGDGAHLLQAATNPNAGTPYKIFVHVIEARGLISNDPNHLSDALCIVELGPTVRERRSTSVQEATMNAVWDQVFLFDDVLLQKHEFGAEKISLSVLHKSDFRRNKLIGNYEFSLGNIYRQKSHQYYRQWVPLTVPERPENEEGYLLVTVYVLGPNDPTPMHEPVSSVDDGDESGAQLLQAPSQGDKRMFHLNVLIYRAVDVLTTQYGGEGAALNEAGVRDTGVMPFVSARFNGNVLQTTVAASDSADRTWNRALELPFHLPLRSDSIEIILWNRRTGLKDQIIGVKTFNFFQMGLAHKAWGPRWVNLYASDYVSPQTTLLGKIKHYWLSEKTLHKHEYVGRILMRMSVLPTDEALLMSKPCAPALDPKGDDFTLQFMLYSASELPVLGGKICVEIVFGVHRVKSAWVFSKAGQSGTFVFHESFPPISTHVPLDRSQAHHVFLNVYHRVGGKVVKVAFERIPIASLLPPEGAAGPYYYLNGSTRIGRHAMNTWPSKWRTLQHVHPDRNTRHVTAGFVLATIGYGLKRNFPPADSIPSPVPTNYQKYTLRVYVHQAANLLAAMENGCSNPLLAIRFSGRSLVLPCQQSNTLFPLWFECRELRGVYLDILRAPSVYLHVLHQTTLGYVTLGRAEIAAEHVLNNQGMLCRYRVRYDQDSGAAGGEDSADAAVPGASPPGSNDVPVNAAGMPVGQRGGAKKNLNDYLLSSMATRVAADVEPYVLASFELFPDVERGRFPVDPNFPPATRDFVVKVEAIGLRELRGELEDPSLQPELEIAVPVLQFDNRGGGGGPTPRGKQLLTAGESEPGSTATPGGPMLPPGSHHGPSDDGGDTTTDGGGGGDDDEDSLRPTITWEPQSPACARPSGMGVQVLNIATFTRVALPVTDPYSIPLRIRVLDGGSSEPKHCYCARFIPLSELLDLPLDIPRPPTYKGERYTSGSTSGGALGPGGMENAESSMAPMGAGSMASGGLIGSGASSSLAYDELEGEGSGGTAGAGGGGGLGGGTGYTMPGGFGGHEVRRVKSHQALSAENDIPKEYEGLIMHVEDDDDDGGGGGGGGGLEGASNPGALGAASARARDETEPAGLEDLALEDPFTLELDPLQLNVGSGTASEEIKFTHEWRNDGAVVRRAAPGTARDSARGNGTAAASAAAAASSAGESKEAAEDDSPDEPRVPARPRLRLLSLFRTQGGWNRGPGAVEEACVLKAYARCRALPSNAREADRMLSALERDNLINPIKPLYERGYMARVYVYTGINLAPLASFLDSAQSGNPYLVATNGPGANHRVSYKAKAKKDDLNPDFFQVFDLPTSMPDHYKLSVQVWNAGLIGDEMIGAVVIDLETRLLQQTEAALAAAEGQGEGFVATTEYHDLKNESARTSQGKLSMRLEVLTEEDARRTKPDDVVPAASTEYELRMIIWSTRDVKFPTAADADGAVDDVNQRVAVTTNFQNKRGREVVKTTDVAWNSAGGQADWNYRMKWRLSIPSKLPRLKLAMWHETVMSDNLLIGECLYNLTPFFAKCMRDKRPISKTDMEWVPFVHPLYRHTNLGAVQVEFHLLTDTEADRNPVGEAQNEPNREPYLRDPKRNAPPWAIGSKAFAAMAKWKLYLLYAIAFCVLVGLGVAFIVPIVITM